MDTALERTIKSLDTSRSEPVIAVIGTEPDPERWHQLGDLEIVQRALVKSNAGSVELFAQGDWALFGRKGNHLDSGYDCQSLLTWAKQTLGVSDAAE